MNHLYLSGRQEQRGWKIADVFLQGFPGGTSGKDPACQCMRHKRRGFSPWSSGEENGTPRQCSCLGNPLDRRAQRVQYNWAESYIFYRSGLQVIYFMVTHMTLAKIQLPNCKIPKKFSIETVSLKKKKKSMSLAGLNINIIAWHNEWTKNLAIIETLAKIF